jgi:hypothetical protein
MNTDSPIDHLTARAVRACIISATRAGIELPMIERTSVDRIGGRQYVTLHAGSGVMAVYRVRNAGQLKRLKCPPPELMGRDKGQAGAKGAPKGESPSWA